MSEPRTAAAADVSDPSWADPAVTLPTPGSAVADIPATGLARVGDLPVLIGRASGVAGPGRVRVTVLDEVSRSAVGARGMVFRVERADGSPHATRVALVIDYSGFRQAYGGDFPSRLRLVSVPPCAFNRTDESCPAPASLRARNDLTTSRLLTDVVVVGDPTSADGAAASPMTPDASDAPLSATADSGTFATMSTPSGAAGDYGATSLSSTTKWALGANSGTFTWSYPVPVPPAPAGPAPGLSIDYSSQSVDGRTAKANSQSSQFGEGFSFEPGFIERRFTPCVDDGHPTWGDLCYQTPEYYLHFGGRSSELVRSTGNDWRLRDDPAWRIRSWTGAQNGDAAGDWWSLLTPDGTEHVFGYGHEPTSDLPTEAAWTVPMFGDDPGEPCYSSTLENAHCMKAWRWNLDRVVDVHGNVMTLFWGKEKNYYARNAVSTRVSQYDRGGFLDHVDYGKRDGRETEAASAYVDITTSHRCTTHVNCPQLTSSTDTDTYPDVPLDLMCWSATSCPGQYSPSFFSTEKIAKIATFVRNSAALVNPSYSDVDELTFSYTFPSTAADDASASLFLTGIRRDGLVGTRVTLPTVLIGGTAFQNRVDANPSGGVPALRKYRVTSIEDELGATVHVTYGQPNPCTASALPAWNTNTTDCFPQFYKPDGAPPGWGAFRKYLVTAVLVDDTTVPDMPSMPTSYGYLGTPAWHYDDELHTPASQQSWSDYRGYEQVQVEAGAGGSRSISRHKYFRGMHGDKLVGTTTKVANVVDSESGTFADVNYKAGYLLESSSYNGALSHVASTLYRYWGQNTVVGPTAFQRHDAQYVRQQSSIAKVRDTAPGGGWRYRRVDATYDPTYAVRLTLTDLGDTAWPAGDESCRSTQYTVNGSTWLLAAPYVTRNYDGTCATGTQIARTETYYDGSGTLGATPSKGLPTRSVQLYNSAQAAVTATTYDPLGRVTSTTAPNQWGKPAPARTTVDYDPTVTGDVDGYPYNGVVTRNPAGHSTKSELSFAWGTPHRVTDVNGRVTTVARDALGRIVSVQRPEDPAGVPGLRYTYTVSQSSPSHTKSESLLHGSTYVTAYTYIDSFGRPVETHTRSPHTVNGGFPHRLVSQTRYDDQGRVVAESQPMYNQVALGAGLLNPDTVNIPAEERYGYDFLGRRTTVSQYAATIEQWRTTTIYEGWRHRIDYPVRRDVTYHQNALGQTNRITEALDSGTADTTFEYTALGDLTKITDAAGNASTFTYDWLRRRTATTDPDQGSWLAGYDANGNLTSVRDAKLQTVTYAYDSLDRRTAATAGTTTLATWAYDNPTAGMNGIGRPHTTTRHYGADEYKQTITGYDQRGRVTGKTWTIPPVEAGLNGDYTYAFAYDPADHLISTTYPEVGAVAAETVTAAYDGIGYFKTLTGAEPYIRGTGYTDAGRLASRESGTGTGGSDVVRGFTYGDAANRLTNVTSSTAVAGVPGSAIENVTYTYDAESNLTAVTDTVAGSKECFRYDALNRLTAAYTTVPASTCGSTLPAAGAGPDPYALGYSINSVGNITASTSNGAGTTWTYSLAAGSTGGPHAADTIGTTSYQYDANGALAKRTQGGVDLVLAWDEFHKLRSTGPTATTQTLVNVYDADGNRLVRREVSGTTTIRTLYLDGLEVRVTDTGGSIGPQTVTRFYGTSAMRVVAPGGSTLYRLLHNVQNSVTTTVDAATGTVTTRRHQPYGTPRNAAVTLPTERDFLNKTRDPNDLVAVGARMYEPAAGRFVSVDPLIDPSDPRTLNGYAYALHNPATFLDPTGLIPFGICFSCPIQQVGGVFKGMGEGAVGLVTGTASTAWEVSGLVGIRGPGVFEENWSATAEFGSMFAQDPIGVMRDVGYGIVEPIVTDWRDGNYGEAIGRAGFDIMGALKARSAARAHRLRKLDAPDVPTPAAVARAADKVPDAPLRGIPDAKRLTPAEQATAARLQRHPDFTARAFKESEHDGADYIDDRGRSYDAMGSPEASRHWNDGSLFIRAIDNHLRKSTDFTVIDLTGFTAEQIGIVRGYVNSLPDKAQARIVRIGF